MILILHVAMCQSNHLPLTINHIYTWLFLCGVQGDIHVPLPMNFVFTFGEHLNLGLSSSNLTHYAQHTSLDVEPVLFLICCHGDKIWRFYNGVSDIWLTGQMWPLEGHFLLSISISSAAWGFPHQVFSLDFWCSCWLQPLEAQGSLNRAKISVPLPSWRMKQTSWSHGFDCYGEEEVGVQEHI